MPFNRVIESLNVIQELSDLPNEDDNLTADELKARFDKGVNILKEYVFSFIDELEGNGAANKIGYDGAHETIGEALKALESAGVGTIPPDDTITTAKIQNEAVTELKLALDLTNKINATKVKFGTITPTYTGDTTIDNGTSAYVTVDKTQEFDIGFKPSAVVLFKIDKLTEVSLLRETTGTRKIFPYGVAMGQIETRTNKCDEFTQYGGVAMIGQPCMCNNSKEVFKIEQNKIITHQYKYNNTDNDSASQYTIGTTDTLYYIAIA